MDEVLLVSDKAGRGLQSDSVLDCNLPPPPVTEEEEACSLEVLLDSEAEGPDLPSALITDRTWCFRPFQLKRKLRAFLRRHFLVTAKRFIFICFFN